MPTQRSTTKRYVTYYLPSSLVFSVEDQATKDSRQGTKRIRGSHIVERLLREGLARKSKANEADTAIEAN